METPMREVVLDTETTGLNPEEGHRIVEVGCVELLDRMPTGREFHKYVNPERDVPEEALSIHGITRKTLAEAPVFGDIADELLEFLGDDRLVIHHASFDIGFLNAEFGHMGRPLLPMTRTTDTVALARRRFPGASASLDALCRRYGISLAERRPGHGALIDARLLARVYAELTGGHQQTLELAGTTAPEEPGPSPQAPRTPRFHEPTGKELAAHREFVKSKIRKAIWLG